MAMVCPRCATTHEHRFQCPGCGNALEYPDGEPALSSNPSSHWQQTPWGRIFIGLLLAQGLFYGLRHLVTALVLVAGPVTEPGDETSALFTVVVIQVMQAVTLLAGGMLAGSGQRNGILLGAVVGVWNGVLTGLTPQWAGQSLSAVALYGDPLLQTSLGALAGWMGSTFWKPLPESESRGPQRIVRKAPKRARPPLFAGRIAFFRVLLGSALAVGGTLSASALFALIDRLGEGELAGNGTTLDLVVTWEIKALALIAGGLLGGSNTYNGLKQGLCVGIITALVLAALEAQGVDRWMDAIGLLLLSSTSLCLVGGWFGCQLLPPVVKYRKRSFETSPMA
jgi:hypothetical protein